MKTEFDNWWNKDLLTEDNPHVDGTPAFWAWEGWFAGVNAEREACAKVCESLIVGVPSYFEIDERLEECAASIRSKGQS